MCAQAPVEALQASAAWSDMFSRKFRRLVGLASSLVALQQLSGINVIVFYSTQARNPLPCTRDLNVVHMVCRSLHSILQCILFVGSRSHILWL